MRVAVINGTMDASMEEIHDCLKRSLQFPSYYGNNLDALYDLLSTEDRTTLLLLFDSKELVKGLGSKGEKLVGTFQDAALANQHIRFIRIERKGMQSQGVMV